MPPTSRRTDRAPAAASSSRSRMYNLAGHAHSSGSLLPRSTDVHAASASAAPAVPTRAVDAADAPYLTNLESHFGRVTLTAPDNLLRKQAKEKKQKIRQRKAQNAQAAAAALAGTSQPALSSSAGRNAMASSSNLLDTSRRYQTTLDDAHASTGLLVPPSGQHMGMRRAYSGGQTPTLASTSQPPPTSTTQTVVARTRRRRPSSAARDDPSSRPASRASEPSRPESALSQNDADPSQPEVVVSTAPQPQPIDIRPPRSRTESAPSIQRRSHNAFDTAPTAPTPADSTQAPIPASNPVAQTSLHRQNVWNDITEADPDDLPPPFPEGAPRPPTPPRPPTHDQAANDAQLVGPQPHARIPDSPPPAFVSDDEDDAVSASEDLPPQTHPSEGESQVQTTAATDSRPESRASTPSSASASDDESIELTEERRAWEADIRNGLSFDVRVLREQQRRVARERAAALRGAPVEQEMVASAETVESATQAATTSPATESLERALQFSQRVLQEDTLAAVRTPTHSVAEHEPVVTIASGDPLTHPANVAQDESTSDARVADTEGSPQPQPSVTGPAVQRNQAATSAHVEEPLGSQPVPVASVPILSAAASTDQTASSLQAPGAQPSVSAAGAPQADATGRLVLANETRLGLPPMSAPSRFTSGVTTGRTPQDVATHPPSSIARNTPVGHRKTNSDIPSSAARQTLQRNQGNSRAGANGRASLSSFAGRRLVQGQAVRGHDSDSSLPLSRRPEDTLYVISAPPPASHGKTSSEDEASVSQQAIVAPRPVADRTGDAEDGASSGHESDDDDGAESDSSIEQWLAESAAFDALRKREEEAAARLQALQEPPVSESDEEEDAAMPGAFSHRASARPRHSGIARKVPDPANLASMDSTLPKAPPPLVLGRSRGGAAYSDSSSESTDTDDALDQYSSSDEDDEQHRAFYDARAAEAVPKDAFANAHKSVHARTTSSAPNLTIADDASKEEVSETADVAAEPVQNIDQRQAAPSVSTPRSSDQQKLLSHGPTRSLSLKAQGKLPERVDAPVADRETQQRAGDFEEDTSSSRNVSDVEEPVAFAKPLPPSSPTTQTRTMLQRKTEPNLPGLVGPVQVGMRRTSLDPLLQPLGYGQIGRNDLRDRLKDLFGQPLVSGAASQIHDQQANAHKSSASTTQALPGRVEDRQASSGSRQLSERSLPSLAEGPASVAPTLPKTAMLNRDDDVSTLASRAPALGRHSSVTSRPSVSRISDINEAEANRLPSKLPEQKARDEALLQIAQLSASTQTRQDSLAALERLLAKTGRPTSMLPPSTITRAELGGRLQLTPDVDGADAQGSSEPGGSSIEQAALEPSNNRLSRQGAIVRGRGPLPSPPSGLSRASSSATRPVSFVNPRSSAAPLPRGRLPAITDATRHFPPSASSAGPGVAPSWLSYIPSEERDRLPAPLEPQRAAGRAPVGKVSAMISRFETAPSTSRDQQESRSTGSPTKQLPETGGIRRTESNRSLGNNAAEAVEERADPAVFRRFSRAEGEDECGHGGALRRRPPPPPPPSTLSTRRSDSSTLRISETAERPNSSASGMTQSDSMEALAREIDQAASEWSAASLHDAGDAQQRERPSSTSSSRLTVPASAATNPHVRSPRTQAMDTLTGRAHVPGGFTPPPLPSKSPLMTPEQIARSASGNGLSEAIAAAQVAAAARMRDGRGGRGYEVSESVGAGARPLPSLPASLRMHHGLGISGEGEGSGRGRELPVPPPLPVRPRGRDWDNWGNGFRGVEGARVAEAAAVSSTGGAQSGAGSSANGNAGREEVERALRSASPTADDTPPDSNASGSTSTANVPSSSTSTAPRRAPSLESNASASVSTAVTPASAGPSATPRRAPSLGLTDFDLLVASLESQPSSSNYESLSAITEFLGPAKPANATAEQLASLSVAVVECDSRRVTRDGKVKQKLSCVGVRVERCGG
ncbi:RING-type domain-containing protein [Pseudozyma hubeiensis]|nr:RING-type domain-containing protein [Pseudozyma hubeiensis]